MFGEIGFRKMNSSEGGGDEWVEMNFQKMNGKFAVVEEMNGVVE